MILDGLQNGVYTNEQNMSYISLTNFGIWILSIILIVKGSKSDYKNKKIDKQKIIEKELEKELKKEDEIQELKDKVEALEKDKERKE